MQKGSYVTMEGDSGLFEYFGEYEFWPKDQYEKYYGSPDSNALGHMCTTHKGQSGYAVFLRPPGVIRITPYEVSNARKVTCLASTSNNLEHWPGEMDVALDQGSLPIKQRVKDIDEARSASHNPDNLDTCVTDLMVSKFGEVVHKTYLISSSGSP